MDDSFPFSETLKQLEIWFRCAGICIKSESYRARDRLKFRFLYILHSFAANYQLLCCIWWCINGLKNGDDFLGITYNAPCITISLLAQFKGLFLIKHESEADKLIASLKTLEKDEEIRRQSEENSEIVKSEMRFLNVVLKTLNMFYAILVAGFSITPLVVIVVKYIQTKEVELILPFFTAHGFDPLVKTIWPFIYFHQFWSELAVVMNICSADYFFFTCCTYIRIQFRLLAHAFENIIPDDGRTNKIFREDEEFRSKFNKLVMWHQELIDSASILEIIYSKSTLMNFFSSSLIICLTGFNVTIVHDAANIMTFMSFLFLSLVQVFFVCFFADLLMTSSTDISDSVYSSQLYRTEAKIGRKLLIVTVRSQKPCKITAAGYADVNLKSFMRVLSTAWSYFALLQTMYGN